MVKMVTIIITIILTLIIPSSGAFLFSNGYTLTGEMSVNGSGPNGGCPQIVEGLKVGSRRVFVMTQGILQRLDSLLMGWYQL